MKLKNGILIGLSLILSSCPMILAQPIATISVEAGLYNRHHTPVSINLDQITWLPDSALLLAEVTESVTTFVPVQVEQGAGRKLWWIIPALKAGEIKEYRLFQGKSLEVAYDVNSERSADALTVSVRGKEMLKYNSGTVYPPQGIDSSFRRSGFIHPLWAPNGAVLTNIQPNDHYHHYGFWNPWTDTEFEGQNIDFWNIGRKQGTVRFNSYISVTGGDIFGGFKALQDHVIFPDSAPRTVMNEVWDIKAYNIPGRFLWDFTSTLNMAVQSKLIIKEYRYAGLGMRATAEWTNKNSEALSSEGRTRKDIDGTRARWCMIDGETGKGHAGILFMSCPSNYNHPEPVRMWPEDANNGRGDVFFNFCPTKNMDWILEPGKDYALKYRILVFDQKLSNEEAESAWNDFANPPVVKFRKH
jgi:hypothetical protein